ncbi:hypothetical protein C8N40_109204 [Pontibacter mucosus]|uniref:Uncharacterized protein n=1 Tax=Pontibacter mucosus TaxID=1649266 RepID=A0A2T5YEH3_9BACT|nr:hypothetical protein C8N40_109204 [Pontibacter mucosus]
MGQIQYLPQPECVIAMLTMPKLEGRFSTATTYEVARNSIWTFAYVAPYQQESHIQAAYGCPGHRQGYLRAAPFL